eukprot:CAMPEP_0182421016 /NCGR_PEP_ID=MMETSP1167-20130531/6181_1 /TAXON_ID=2988 /ORGANISM="Mallomonas Sp, Strain CCMP3275" /LENGTH=798 /DNA_ID=CAMNT_0024597697 /DNA_START=51 /DNA_END=2447 /DNA_ORIENTATION=+
MNSSPDVSVIMLDQGWDNVIKATAIVPLQTMLDEGFEGKTKLFSNKEYASTYTICYNMCTQKSPFNWSEQLYIRHGQTISVYLERVVFPALKDRHDEFLLKELVRRWENHKVMNKWMQKFFMYLDRYYVKYHSLPSLAESGLGHFKQLVFERLKKDLTNALLDLVNQEREGSVIDRDLVRACVELYETMGMGSTDVYDSDLETPLLQSTREYYARKAQAWIQENSTPVYMEKVERALEEERERVHAYLLPATEVRLLRVLDEETLEKCQMELLEKEGSGARVLLANEKSEDLSRLFRLFSRLPDGLSPIAAILREHIVSLGNDRVDQRQARLEGREREREKGGSGEKGGKEGGEREGREKETNQDPQFVKDLLELHDKSLALVNTNFAGNALFQKALTDAFTEVVNRDVGKFPNADLLSSFCDRILKSGGEKLSDAEVETYLEKIVQLFFYLSDQDLFAEIYRNQLAKRLLNQRCSSDDMERLMIGKLKLKCGAQFTSKMEGMINDLALGADHQSDFDRYWRERERSRANRMEFQVTVLTGGHWPTYGQLEPALPPVMSKAIDVFKEYYESRTAKRRLQWVHSLGSVAIRAVFKKNTYELTLTTLQAIVLMAFNVPDSPTTPAIDSSTDPSPSLSPSPLSSSLSSSTRVKWSLSELAERLQLAEDPLKRALHSLACGKVKVLKKDGTTGHIKHSDTFIVNENFTSSLRKIRIPMAALEESHNPKRVEEDRGIAIEAAIVRIMKARKTLSHQQLVAETLTQLSFFQPQPKVVKRRIEALIDREYLARDDDNPNTYKYLA